MCRFCDAHGCKRKAEKRKKVLVVVVVEEEEEEEKWTMGRWGVTEGLCWRRH